MADRFYVAGGEFTQTDWKQLHRQAEVFGPYRDYTMAMNVWRAETARRVDDAHHRLFIIREKDWTNFLESIPDKESQRLLEEARKDSARKS